MGSLPVIQWAFLMFTPLFQSLVELAVLSSATFTSSTTDMVKTMCHTAESTSSELDLNLGLLCLLLERYVD